MAPDNTDQPSLIRSQIMTDFGNQARVEGTPDEAVRQYRAVVEATGYFDIGSLPSAMSPEMSPERETPNSTPEIADEEYTEEQTESFSIDGIALSDAVGLTLYPLLDSPSLPDFEIGMADIDIMPAAMADEVHGVNAISVAITSLADPSG